MSQTLSRLHWNTTANRELSAQHAIKTPYPSRMRRHVSDVNRILSEAMTENLARDKVRTKKISVTYICFCARVNCMLLRSFAV